MNWDISSFQGRAFHSISKKKKECLIKMMLDEKVQELDEKKKFQYWFR